MEILASFQEWLPLLIVLAGIGCIAGFLSGLMGIGGGIVLVPGLFYSMSALGFSPEHLMHMAVGTSLAVMVPTGLSSARAHWKKGAVDMSLVRKMGPGILLGVGIGTLLADHFSSEGLRTFFACALVALAAIMVIDPARFAIRDGLPKQPWSGMAGAVIGVISTLMGIGGATMNVPFMCLHKVPMHKAVGTAAAQGLFISVPGLIGFIIIGWSAQGLPAFSLGYANLIAWAAIIPFSVLMAPQGARVAHSLPVGRLREVFAALLVIIAARMLWDVFHG